MSTFRTVLHPTDFSRRADYAFQLACSFARDRGARLIVLHAAEPPMTAYGGVMTPPPPPQEYRREAEEQLRQFQAPGAEVRIERRLEEGAPAEEILRVAKEVNCDLIVMGTHGRTGLGRLLMGSVAEQVVRKAPCPVVTVKAPHEETPESITPAGAEGRFSRLPIGAILHPTDLSDHSSYTLQLACSLARDQGARLIVLHVAVPPMVAYGEALVEIASEDSRETLEEKLSHLVRPEDARVRVEYHTVHQGDPAQEVCRFAQESNCDLIVMGTHGRTGLGRLLMGSVAERVVRQAPCPVLTAKLPPAEARPSSESRPEESGQALEDSVRGAFTTPQA